MFCRKCGAQIDEGSKFCVNCATPVDAANNTVNENFIQTQNYGVSSYGDGLSAYGGNSANSLFGDKNGVFYKNIGLFFAAAGMFIIEAIMFYLPMLNLDVIIYDNSYSILDFWSMADSNIRDFFATVTAVLFLVALIWFILVLVHKRFRKSSVFAVPLAASVISFSIYAFTLLCLYEGSNFGVVESAIIEEITSVLPAALIYPIAEFIELILCVILISRFSRDEKAKTDASRNRFNQNQLNVYVQQLENTNYNRQAANNDFNSFYQQTVVDTNNQNTMI